MSNPEDLLTVLRDVNSPPGGWRYTPPQTGVTITASFWNELRQKTIAHLSANSVTITDEMLLEIEDGACRETPAAGRWCGPRPPKPVEGALPHLTLAHLERFLKTIWHALLTRNFVGREEAERRAEICRTCPLITGGLGGCSGCYDLLKKAQSIVEKNPIVMDPDAEVCGACGCYVPVLVHLPNSTLDRAVGEKMPKYQQGHCWRLE